MKLEEVWPALREGSRVMNSDWCEGEYIVWQAGYPDGIPINENTARATGIEQGTVKKFAPYVMRHTVHGDFEPYVMSQSDMTSTIWQIIPNDWVMTQPTPSVHVNRCKNPGTEGECNC